MKYDQTIDELTGHTLITLQYEIWSNNQWINQTHFNNWNMRYDQTINELTRHTLITLQYEIW